MREFIDNIIHSYLSASDDDVREGMEWYDSTHQLALSLSPDNVWRGAGVFAAYSINTQWPRNLELATDSLRTGVARTDCLSMSSGFAQRILDGEHPFEVFGERANKVRAFTAAIADPANSTIATIDRHARDVAFGYVVGAQVKIGKRLFNELSDAYIAAAELAGISVAQTQAVTWVYWRRQKGVRV